MQTEYSRRQFLANSVGMLGLVAACGSVKRVRSLKPNIILFMADDLGYGDVNCYGHPEIKTPIIDQIGCDGVKFTSFYANAPECTPTRTALLTGRYQHRVGGLECALGIGNVGRYDDAMRLRETHDLGLPVEETSIARLLKNAGYNTAICGKWHLGYEPKFSPNKHGFDYAFYAIGGAMDYFHYVEPPPSNMYALYENEEPAEREGYFTDLITAGSINFLENRTTDKPFFLYVPYTAPHSPHQGPDDYQPQPIAEDSELWNQSHPGSYRAMIEHMDKSVGAILEKLSGSELDTNTLIIFMSDNGAAAVGNNGRLRGNKGGVFEGGIRVPCLARWPGNIPAGIVSDQPCMTMDFAASMLRIAGTSLPEGRPPDGIDIIKLVEENQPVQRRTLFWRARRASHTRKAVRDGHLKYIHLQETDGQSEYLFDLSTDLGETRNLLHDRPDDVVNLKKMLDDWENKVKPAR